MAKFQPGESGNAAGRPRGVPNKTTQEVRTLAARLVGTPRYWRFVKERLYKGDLPWPLEKALLAYCYGAPPNHLQVELTPQHVAPLCISGPPGLLTCIIPGLGSFRRVTNEDGDATDPVSFRFDPYPDDDGA